MIVSTASIGLSASYVILYNHIGEEGLKTQETLAAAVLGAAVYGQSIDSYSEEDLELIEAYKRLPVYFQQNDTVKEILRRRGVYWAGEDYYCVSVRDMDPQEVKFFDYHEMCHHFVYQDYEHFCNKGPQSYFYLG